MSSGCGGHLRRESPTAYAHRFAGEMRLIRTFVEVTVPWVRARHEAHLWLQGLHRPKRYGLAGSPAALLAITRSSHDCHFAPPSVYLRRRITRPWLEDSTALERPHICPPEPTHAYRCLAERLLAHMLRIFLHMCRAIAFCQPAHRAGHPPGLLRLALQAKTPKQHAHTPDTPAP